MTELKMKEMQLINWFGCPNLIYTRERIHLVAMLTTDEEMKNIEQDLIYVGMVGMIDPPRLEVKDAVDKCEKAGIKTVMITGDHKITAIAIAKSLGILQSEEEALTGAELEKMSDEDLTKNIRKYSVYARVSPEHKVRIVKAWQANGEVVAMTGDGVNDILAMKEADCSIAIGSGSDAARGTAQVVLLDSDFGKMRNIVYEGRKNINNITRSASLFTYKNIFSLLLSIYSIIFAMQYPLEPNQVSLGSAFTIGIPAFLLTFEENQKKQQNGNFMRKVFTNSLPAAITSFLAIVAMVKFSDLFNVGVKEITTACSYLFFTGGFLILYKIIRPLNKYRTSVMFLCILGIILTINIMPNFFAIKEISERSSILVTLFAIAEFSVIRWVTLILDKYEKNRKSNA